jgi:hypothetical protein
MSLLDAPILPAITSTTGAERLAAVYGGVEVGFPSNLILGLGSADVGTRSTTGTITKRLTTFTGTSGSAVVINLPSVSGDLRDVILMNVSATSGSVVTLTAASGLLTGATAGLTTFTVGIGVTVRLLSDGTKWYLISAA